MRRSWCVGMRRCTGRREGRRGQHWQIIEITGGTNIGYIRANPAFAVIRQQHQIPQMVLADAQDPLISAATLVESSIVMRAKTGDHGVADLDDLLAAAAVRCVAVDDVQAHLARDAFARFGRGVRRQD